MTAEEEAVLDAAYIAGSLEAESKFEHYYASDLLRFHAARYAESVDQVPVGTYA